MKRGSSGLSLLVAVNKPAGMTSHDVVNRCRSIFGERRVGHTGTLDPLATGVLPICVGPATRLDRYLAGHGKDYRVTMRFGFETTTDDALGEPTETGPILADLVDGGFAREYVGGLVGKHLQVPPRYSAIKVGGEKAYDAARRGGSLALEPREVEVLKASLVGRRQAGDALEWTIDFSVSKGTYIRALVRDMGRELGCPAHVSTLCRLRAGSIALEDCVSLESLASLGESASIDPVRALGLRVVFADKFGPRIESGARIDGRALEVFELSAAGSCTPSSIASERPLGADECVCVVIANRLKALYRYDAATGVLVPDCVFSVPVARM